LRYHHVTANLSVDTVRRWPDTFDAADLTCPLSSARS
jgi:hypothetical protein